MDLQTLTVDDVLQIHQALVQEFENSGDPISPSGVNSQTLLGSAVTRQQCGAGNTLKYPDPVENAATLLFGICCDHPFLNGNKRTALVSMLVHLDKNRLTLNDTKEKDLYDMVMKVANHTLGIRVDKRTARKNPVARRLADTEVEAIVHWLRPRVRRVVRGERLLTYSQLRTILRRFDCDLKYRNNNSIDIVKYRNVRKGVIKKTIVTEEKRVASIPYRRDNVYVPLHTLKYVRERCSLREEDGVDSSSFYEKQDVVDVFINKHRTLLRRLAKT